MGKPNITLKDAHRLLDENLRLINLLQQIIMPLQRNHEELNMLHNLAGEVLENEASDKNGANYDEYERLYNNIWDLIHAFNKDTARYFKKEIHIERVALRYESLLYYYMGVVGQSMTIAELLLVEEENEEGPNKNQMRII